MKYLVQRAALVALLAPASLVRAADAPAPGQTPPSAGQGSTLPAPPQPAQPAPPAAPEVPATAPEVPAVPEAPPPPEIDEAARKLIGLINEAYKNVKSYSATLDTTITGVRNEPITFKVEAAFERPDKALVRRTEEGDTAVFAAEGNTVYISTTQVKGKYLKRTAPPTAKAITVPLSRTEGIVPGLDFWLLGGDLLKETAGGLKSFKLGPADMVEGLPVDTIVMVLRTQNGDAKFVFAAGKEDHLLRRVTVERKIKKRDGSESDFRGVELHRNVQINLALTPAMIRFTPPAGAKAAESLEPPRFDERLKKGAVPFKFTAKDLDGKPLSLDQYKGKVVLLDFWATWCEPCMMELPTVQAAYKKYHAKGFDIVGVSLDQDKAALTTFLKESKLPWRQTFDGKVYDGAIPTLYGVTAIPFAVLIGRDGKIADLDLRGPDLDKAVNAALAKKTVVAAPKTKPKAKTKKR